MKRRRKASELEMALTVYQALKDIRDSRMELKDSNTKERCSRLLDKVLTVLEKAI